MVPADRSSVLGVTLQPGLVSQLTLNMLQGRLFCPFWAIKTLSLTLFQFLIQSLLLSKQVPKGTVGSLFLSPCLEQLVHLCLLALKTRQIYLNQQNLYLHPCCTQQGFLGLPFHRMCAFLLALGSVNS